MFLKGHCPAEIEKFRLAYFHVIPPNTTKYTNYLDKKVLYNKTKAVVFDYFGHNRDHNRDDNSGHNRENTLFQPGQGLE